MRALTFHGVEQVVCERIADPALRGPTDVIVEVEETAICGSDLHVYHGREVGLDAGTVLGHEFVGTVVEIGDDVRGLGRGARVVSPFTTSCGDCFYCGIGLTARCARGQLFGWVEGGSGLHGGQAEYVRVPLADSTLVRVPDGVDPGQALFAGDILATGAFSANLAGIRGGETVAVVGCGPVGMMAIVGARELGAGRVFALDRVPERLELAGRFGAEPVDVNQVEPGEVLRAATDGRGADAVLEVVGSAAASRLAYDLVRAGGTIAAAGVHTEPHLAFSPEEAYDKNLTYRAGRCSARAYMERALEWVAGGRHPLGDIVSHRLPLDQGVRGYDIFARRIDGCTKVVLAP